MNSYINNNLDWIKSGKIGCTFAALFARNPEAIGWVFIVDPIEMKVPDNALLLSFIFTSKDKRQVRAWALNNGFFAEPTSMITEGLRYKFHQGVSWVQYFGPDADVITRRTPHAMLTMSVRLPARYYVKVGFKGILHIAHASVKGLSDYVANRLWSSSLRNTEKQLGHKPTILEAAKTTFHV